MIKENILEIHFRWLEKIAQIYIGIFIFLAFDFCRFCVVIRFFTPATTANDLRPRRIFYPRFYPLHLFSCLNFFFRKSQYFPFWMFSAKQWHYWYHFYNVFVMTRSLTLDWTRDLPHSKPAICVKAKVNTELKYVCLLLFCKL